MNSQFKTLIVVFAYLLVSLICNANDDFNYTDENKCTNVRLDKNGSVAKVPVHDQDGTPLCSSYVTALLIDSWRISHDPPVTELTSPIPLGLQYASATNQGRIKDLATLDMLDYAPKLDSCSYNVVRDEFNSKTSGDFLSELISNYKAAKNDSSMRSRSAQAILNCVLGSGSKQSFGIDKINDYLNENNWINFVNRIMNDLCEGHKKTLSPIPKPIAFRSIDVKKQFSAMNLFIKQINENLNKPNAQPMGITYCKKVLKDGAFEGVTLNGVLDKKSCPDDYSGGNGETNIHASAIVGRRSIKIKNSDGTTEDVCQFLVRNTKGDTCNNYEDDPQALPLKDGKKPKTCENGQIWIDEDDLLRNTAELFYLPPPGKNKK